MSDELKQRILAEIAREYPNGVYFAALYVRPRDGSEPVVTVIADALLDSPKDERPHAA